MPFTLSSMFARTAQGLTKHGSMIFRLQAAAKVSTARARLEMGNTSAVKWIGVIGEYRTDLGPGYRMYLAKDGADLVILLSGGTKQRQQADIERAKMWWTEYKARKVALRARKR